jgi:uncharacterized membrane protein
MTWLAIVGLIVWVFLLTRRVSGLEARLTMLTRLQAPPQAPLEAPAERPGEDQIAPLGPAAPAVVGRDQASVRPPPKAPQLQIRAWLEENGLAWAGGMVLAIGGLLLVAYAAQQGVFTPPFRIAAAVALGALMLAASEWLRRQGQGPALEHPLPAAVAAGAGAATLYGAAWGSYWLYGFIPLLAAGALLALISLGLLGLAFRHGQALAIVAISGGFLAPVVTGPQNWAAPALTTQLALMTVAGYLVAAARRWTWAGHATLLGAVAWAVAGYAAEGFDRVTALAVATVALAFLAVAWRRRRGDPAEEIASSGFAVLPNAALASAAALVCLLWFVSPGPDSLAAAGVGAAAVAVLGALGARRDLLFEKIRPIAYLPAAGAVAPFIGHFETAGPREAWALGLMVVAPAAGVWATLGARTLRARLAPAAGALAALLLALVAEGALTAPVPWAPLAVLAVLLSGCAALLARASEAPETDLALAVWLWIAGAAALASLPRAFGPPILPVAAAGLSLLAAALHRRLGWRGFAAVAIAAALGALSALLRPAILHALQAGDLRWWSMTAIAGGAAALVYAGARMARRHDRPVAAAEALSTGALLILLTGLFLVLRQQGMTDAVGGARLDPFFEASLRTLLILAAGLLSAQGVRDDARGIGRWRGAVLLLAGLFHGLLFELLLLNPLVLDWRPAVTGPRLFDSLAVGFLAPAVLLGVATKRKIAFERWLLVAYAAGAAIFGVAWALLETRRLFQGATLRAGLDLVGRAEACAYAIIVLLVARALLRAGETVARRRWTISSLPAELGLAGRAAAWPALGFALLVFAWWASPWWGLIDRPVMGHGAAALLFAGYALGGLAAGTLIGVARRLGHLLLSRASRLAAIVVAFCLLTLLVRYAFHGLDMRARLQEMSLETWTFSAAWGVFGVGLLLYGVIRLSNDLRAAGLLVLLATTAKIFLFDMARLEGVVRAGSFLAVGALLLAAAVLVRRLGGSERLLKFRATPTDP